MNKIDIENKLNELENCKYINFHLKNGNILSCPPKNIIAYLDDELLIIPNEKIRFKDLTYIDSYN